MRKWIVLAAISCIANVNVKSQTPAFPDGGFETNWQEFTSSKGKYWDFSKTYFLATLNQLYELEGEFGNAPLTAERLAGASAYDGNYSLKLISKNMTLGAQTIFLPGVTAAFYVDILNVDCVLGKPFTARPTALKGWFKYVPVNGDSAEIEIRLKKNGALLGAGKQVVYDAVNDWTEFTVPLYYTSNATPDSIVVIFASSANYNFASIETLLKCHGQVGSALYLDNVSYDYTVSITEIAPYGNGIKLYPNPATEQLNIQIAKETKGTVIIYDYLSRKVEEYPINGTQADIDVRKYASGSYLINVVENNIVVTSARFVKQ
jgi:hypothetical protein